ncbi:Proteasome subunit beta type-3-A [Astathelohania contejeani]|uniref:Proteasome subunit beta type-3-A n=1 Tax=Astathelohania contejeani TaxID=164912 RepID=A0ABQ7I2V4_9MICR|nr:Proteasome subunit beta type-3-A [Thelohania contejeani]
MSEISEYYGGSILAMKGKNVVTIISDNRLAQRSITTSTSYTRIHKINPRLYIGLASFVPDCQVLLKKLIKNYNLFELNEGRPMEPSEFTQMVSYILYSKRFSPYIVMPVIAGIQSDGTPYVANMDQIGCITDPTDFVVAGTAEKNLAGLCEAIYEPELDEEELFTVTTQAFLNAIDRDALSGWGAVCYSITPERVIKRTIKGRQD